MNLLAAAVRALNAGLKAVAGELATYKRGGEAIDQLAIVPLNTRHDSYGLEIEFEPTGRERDFLILAADLVKDGTRWIPTRGDRLTWTDSTGTARAFEVLPRIGDRCFRHTDQTEIQYRVYTLEVAPDAEDET